jgi:protein ImuA
LKGEFAPDADRIAGLRALIAGIEKKPLQLPQGHTGRNRADRNRARHDHAGQDRIEPGAAGSAACAGTDIARSGPCPCLRLLRFGIDAVDAALGPIPAAALHEVRAEAGDETAAAAFALLLGNLAAATGQPVFFVSAGRNRAETGDLYGPGLEALGFAGRRLVRVRARDLQAALWAAGEIAAVPGAGFCLLELAGNPPKAGLTLTRRLALRAAASGTPMLLLRERGQEEASAAGTRWRIAPAPSHTLVPALAPGRGGLLGPPAFDVVLEKSRTGRTGRWILEWSRHERRLALRPEPAAGLRHSA